jgi:hypothetical protein
MDTSKPTILTGRYAIVAYGAMPGAIVLQGKGQRGANVSELRYTQEGGASVVSLVGQPQVCPSWETALVAADRIASGQSVSSSSEQDARPTTRGMADGDHDGHCSCAACQEFLREAHHRL